jgi:tetratricopeptide (TPR) repeat protein
MLSFPKVMKVAVLLVCTAALALGQLTNQKQFERASEALKSGDYATAESGFRKVLDADPHNLGALGNLGVVYSHTHRYAKAIEVYKRALRMSPRDQGVLLDLGLAYLKQNDYTHAAPYFSQLNALRPGNAQSTNLLATCLVFGGHPQAALDLLKPLAEKTPDSATLYLLGVAYSRTGEVDAGKKVFEGLLTSDKTHAQASFILGQGYYDSKLFDKAIESYEDVLRSDAAFPGVHRELGKVYVSLRQNEEAERELRLAVKQDPQDASAVYFLGGLLVQTDRFADGVPYLEQARAMDPDSWATYLYLGKAKLRLKENAAAVRYLEEAGQMNPEEPTVFYLLANALREEGRADEARQALRRVSELHMSSLEADRRSHDAMVAGAR